MFRHTLAQAVLETTGNLKVAQELLGHAQITTTADLYMHVDESALVKALATVKSTFDHTNNQARGSASNQPAERYAFGYDEVTILELEKAVSQPKGVAGEKDL
jgi:integrase